MSALGNAIQEQINRLGWSQADLADTAGIPRPTISRIIAGKVEPELGTLVRISHTLGISLSDLLAAAGYQVDVPWSPDAQVDHLARLARSIPWLAPVAMQIAALPPEHRDAIIGYLDGLQARQTG